VLGLLADELRTRGDVVRVPDLRAAVETAAGWPARVAAAVGEPADAVLGFSGAGVVLPAVAAAVDARRVVWLDAIVPAERGATVTPAARRARLAAGRRPVRPAVPGLRRRRGEGS
jgi:hypothetical protein